MFRHFVASHFFAGILPMVFRLLAPVLLLFVLNSTAWGGIQIPPDAKVGLVLSGGGARGLAHVGVIRVLEAQGIRPVVITGTSMGAIVGALYASGRSAEEIDYVARNMDWRQALSDASPRHHQPYQFRQLEAGMTADLRMSITSKGIRFPRGAIEGQKLEQVLGSLFEKNGQPLRFDQMPIAFAAVASDLETGQAVVLQSGEVASALRASMSVPGALAPLERDGHLLVDGGLADNMPVELARSMGADFIIAVNVSSPLTPRDQLDSVFAVAEQMTNFLVRLNTMEQAKHLRPGDWLIEPQLEAVGSTDFDQADAAIQAGINAAMAGLDNPRPLPALEGTDTSTNSGKEPLISFIRVKNNSPVSDDVVRSVIRQQEGQRLDRAQLEEDLSRLYGLDYFSHVRYRIVRENGQRGLEVEGVARETGNNWLKLGLEVADDFKGNSDFNLAASLRAAGLNRYGGTAFTRLQLGSRLEFESRYLQPLDAGLRYFAEPSIGYRASEIDIYLDDVQEEPLSQYNKSDSWVSFAAGRQLWEERAEWRVGISRATGKLDFRSGIDIAALTSESLRYDDGYYFTRLGWDSLDDLSFPTRGLRGSIAIERHDKDLESEADFSRTLADFTWALSHDRTTLILDADVAVSDSDQGGFVNIPFIGGFLELSGLPPHARFGRHRALGRLVLFHQLAKSGPLPIGVPVYLGGSLERGNVWMKRDNIRWDNAIGAGSIFLGARTPVGSAYLSVGSTEEGDSSLSIFIGHRFR